jgi:hypothetical protein
MLIVLEFLTRNSIVQSLGEKLGDVDGLSLQVLWRAEIERLAQLIYSVYCTAAIRFSSSGQFLWQRGVVLRRSLAALSTTVLESISIDAADLFEIASSIGASTL